MSFLTERCSAKLCFQLLSLAILSAGWIAGVSYELLFLCSVVFAVALLFAFRTADRVVTIISKEGPFTTEAEEEGFAPDQERSSPLPFKQRLARYLHCDVRELDKPRDNWVSKMEFWSAFPLVSRHDPKSVWVIRRLLVRIHKLVHG